MSRVGDAARKRPRNHISQEKGDPVAEVVWRAAKVQLNLPSSQSCEGEDNLFCAMRAYWQAKKRRRPDPGVEMYHSWIKHVTRK
jgi:hypothetical protein